MEISRFREVRKELNVLVALYRGTDGEAIENAPEEAPKLLFAMPRS